MRFQEFLERELQEASLLQQPQQQGSLAKDMAKALAITGAKNALGFIPGIGPLANMIADVGQAAYQVLAKHQQQGVREEDLLKLMKTADNLRAPKNLFDLDDNIAAILNDNIMRQIAKHIIAVLDKNKGRYDRLPDDLANIIAMQMMQQSMQTARQKRAQNIQSRRQTPR